MDEVVGNVGEVAGIEIELAGDDVFPDRMKDRKIAIGRERTIGVVARKLRAILLSVLVVEGRKNDGRAELALINEIDRAFEIAVEADGQRVRKEFLFDSRIEIVSAFRSGRRVHRDGGSCRRVEEP